MSLSVYLWTSAPSESGAQLLAAGAIVDGGAGKQVCSSKPSFAFRRSTNMPFIFMPTFWVASPPHQSHANSFEISVFHFLAVYL